MLQLAPFPECSGNALPFDLQHKLSPARGRQKLLPDCWAPSTKQPFSSRLPPPSPASPPPAQPGPCVAVLLPWRSGSSVLGAPLAPPAAALRQRLLLLSTRAGGGVSQNPAGGPGGGGQSCVLQGESAGSQVAAPVILPRGPSALSQDPWQEAASSGPMEGQDQATVWGLPVALVPACCGSCRPPALPHTAAA